MPVQHSIVVVGAGLGGLMLASVLHARGLRPLVLEGELSPSARTQGGMLDIHDDGGQLALRAAGLLVPFQDLVFHGGDAYRFLDQDGRVLHEQGSSRASTEGDARTSRPEVERGQLRELLLESLPPGTVQWGARVRSCTLLEGGRSELLLCDGQRLGADLLIGADGAWSKVRTLLTDVQPTYAGSVWVQLDLHDADRRNPAAAEVVGRGSLFAIGDGGCLLGHREPGGSLQIYAAVPASEGWAATVNFGDAQVAKNALLGHYAGWSDPLRALIVAADDPLIPRAIHTLPSTHRWDHVRGATLLGDAAHLMPPVGEGANIALMDGGLLAEAIADNPENVDAAVEEYERVMFQRAEAAAVISASRYDALFEEDAARKLLNIFAGLDRPADPDARV